MFGAEVLSAMWLQPGDVTVIGWFRLVPVSVSSSGWL